MQTLCPTWDQTLIFDNVPIYGNVEEVRDNPPPIVLELFDRDAVVSIFRSRHGHQTIVLPQKIKVLQIKLNSVARQPSSQAKLNPNSYQFISLMISLTPLYFISTLPREKMSSLVVL